jgi:hypothetical protein
MNYIRVASLVGALSTVFCFTSEGAFSSRLWHWGVDTFCSLWPKSPDYVPPALPPACLLPPTLIRGVTRLPNLTDTVIEPRFCLSVGGTGKNVTAAHCINKEKAFFVFNIPLPNKYRRHFFDLLAENRAHACTVVDKGIIHAEEIIVEDSGIMGSTQMRMSFSIPIDITVVPLTYFLEFCEKCTDFGVAPAPLLIPFTTQLVPVTTRRNICLQLCDLYAKLSGGSGYPMNAFCLDPRSIMLFVAANGNVEVKIFSALTAFSCFCPPLAYDTGQEEQPAAPEMYIKNVFVSRKRVDMFLLAKTICQIAKMKGFFFDQNGRKMRTANQERSLVSGEVSQKIIAECPDLELFVAKDPAKRWGDIGRLKRIVLDMPFVDIYDFIVLP